MNLVVDDRISQTSDFTNQFALFPIHSGRENLGEKPASRLSRDQLDAFSNAESENACSPHFFTPPAEQPAATSEKSLAAGLMKKKYNYLRSFKGANVGYQRTF